MREFLIALFATIALALIGGAVYFIRRKRKSFRFDLQRFADQGISATQLATLVPTIIATRVMEYLRADMVFPKLALTNFSSELAKEGETVQVPKLNGSAARLKVAHTAIVMDDDTAGHVDVTLDKHAYKAFALEDAAAAASGNKQIRDLYARMCANSLLETMESSFVDTFDTAYVVGTGTISPSASVVAVVGVGTLFLTELRVGDLIGDAVAGYRQVATITDDTHLTVNAVFASAESGVAFNIVQQAIYTTSVDDGAILGARSRLRYQKVGVNEMSLVSNLDDYADILAISTFTGADSINEKSLKEGMAGRIRGLDVYEHNAFDKAYSVAFAPGAIAFASRALPPQIGGVVSSGVVSDPETGIALRYTVSYDKDYMQNQVVIDFQYGVKVLKAEHIVRIGKTL